MAHWMLTDTAGIAKTYATQADGNHAKRRGGAPSGGVSGVATAVPAGMMMLVTPGVAEGEALVFGWLGRAKLLEQQAPFKGR